MALYSDQNVLRRTKMKNDSWRPIDTAPRKERKPIWLKVPGRGPSAAYSDTFWIGGFSVECKPTHWKPRTKPISPISKARAKRLSEYANLKRRWLKGKTCQMCLSKKVDVHHSRGRTGRLLCMIEFWIPLCRFHHNKVKEDPAWAYKHELLGPYGSYNSSKK